MSKRKLFVFSQILGSAALAFAFVAGTGLALAQDSSSNSLPLSNSLPTVDTSTFSPLVGTWVTEPLSEISIRPCDEGYCGYITKVVVPQEIIDQYGDQLDQFEGNFVDSLNEDPALRERPIQGLQILTLGVHIVDGRYDGIIYNPEDGKTYDGFFEMTGTDTAMLTGCVMFNLICRGEEWTRAPVAIGIAE